MLATIIDNQWAYLSQVIGDMEELLVDHFSERHPRIQFIDTEQQAWDGWFRKYSPGTGRLARPLLGELKIFADKYNIPLDIDDQRDAGDRISPAPINPDLLSGITLQDHQVRAIEACRQNEVGLVSAPTGAGKTEMMAAIAKIYSCNTVIIAEQRVVIEQIKERLELRDVVDEDDKGVGLFYGGVTPNGQNVVVGSIASLTSPPASLKRKKPKVYKKRKANAQAFQQIVKNSQLLMVDEADKATDKRYRRLFKNYFNGRYKFGFSGTCFDPAKPVEALILKEHLGSIIIDIERRELEKVGRIVPIHAVMFAAGEDGDKYDRTAYDLAEKELIIENQTYRDRVRKIVESFPDDKTMILVDTNAIETLGLLLESEIEGSKFIYGKTSTKVRQKAIKDFENGDLKCLIGSKILKRGLDLKGGVHNLIICGNGKLTSDFDQKIGRAVRRNDKGWARLFCFLHLDNYYLYKHSKIQLKNIISLGYDVKVVFGHTQLDGKKFVSSNFRIPKKK